MNCAACNSESLAAKDGLCKGCRMKRFVRRKYTWTAEMDAQLTRIYRAAKTKRQLSPVMTEFANRHRMPKYIVQNRAQTLNLRVRVQVPWTDWQVQYLSENAGRFSIAKMAQRVGRSAHAVKHKLFTLGISGLVVEGYSQKELARNFGVPHSTIERWLGRGWLWLDENQRVPHEAVAKFVWDHMPEYRFAAAEEWWLKVTLNPTLGTSRVMGGRKEAA